jgi:thiamine biosynthesis protein ThiS
VSVLDILNMAKIQLNGKQFVLDKKHSLMSLLKKFKINEKKVAVELNGKIVNKNKFSSTVIKNKDKLEVVHFIGGG